MQINAKKGEGRLEPEKSVKSDQPDFWNRLFELAEDEDEAVRYLGATHTL